MRDLVLIGGSTGAIEALQRLLKSVPSNFPAAIFIVVHTTPEGPGLLPNVLSRSSRLPAVFPKHGDPVRRGYVYIAPPDHHLTLGANDTIHVRRGPRENGSRPAIDPLFRTAAVTGYGPRAIAVVLSGYLDDGSAGLYAIRRRGGFGIVQEPKDALVEDMPMRALGYAGADCILAADAIGAKLVELVGQVQKVVTMTTQDRGGAGKSVEPNEDENPPNAFVAYPEESHGTPSVFACPDCHGILWEIKEGGSVRYRCRTGHGYSEATLNEELSHAAENALWAAMRALEEKASMARRIADSTAGPRQWKDRLQERAVGIAAHAEMIRKMIFGEPVAVDESTPSQTESLERDQAD
jgi:two-component system, chemotaxis family, protein-glutamate methylesterase/glutaminase